MLTQGIILATDPTAFKSGFNLKITCVRTRKEMT